MHPASLFLFLSSTGVGDVAESPFIVPVAGCIMILGIVVASIWSGVRTRGMQSQERLAAIARGVPLPPSADEIALLHGRPSADLNRRHANIRLAGLILSFGAAGLILFFIVLSLILQQRDVLCGVAVGLIPLGIGAGFLYDANLQRRELPTTPSATELTLRD